MYDFAYYFLSVGCHTNSMVGSDKLTQLSFIS